MSESSIPAGRPAWRERLIAWAAIAVPLAVLFGPAMASDRLFALRDTGHYYYPLFKGCAGEWSAGRVPLWNPDENCGTSLAADATASLWYPGKLVFALPVDFALSFKLYVVGHAALCAASAYWLARHWGASRFGAALAALAYSCGGCVLFQHANVVYLVGAAWLPLGVGLVEQLFRAPRLTDSLWLAVVLALMVLGGDPQMAYHVVLLGGMCGIVRASAKRWSKSSTSGRGEPPTGAAGSISAGAALVAAAAALALLLAAVQILPSAAAAAVSKRAQAQANLAGPAAPGTHEAATYDFSVPPWRLIELVWPNVGGRMYPTHRRWLSLLPDRTRIWSPSLYLGLFPLVLGLSVFRLRTSDVRICWLSWMVLVFALGSLGTFGLGWLARQAYETGGGDGAAFPVKDAAGGVYWLFTVLLPKYALFRFPAKLLVVAALGVSILAALGWDRALATPPKRLLRALWLLGVTSGLASLVARAAAANFPLGEGAVDPAFGPFDSGGAWQDIQLGLLHACLVACGSAWLLHRPRPWRAAALLAICAAEITWANFWLVPTAPASLWRERSPVAELAASARTFRGGRWWPDEFAAQSSPDRLAQIVAWERQTLGGRYALLDGVPLVNTAPRPIGRADYERLLDQAAGRLSGQLDEGSLRRLGVQFLILPDHANPPFAEKIPASGLPSGAALFQMQPAAAENAAAIQHTFDPAPVGLGAIVSTVSWIVLAAGAALLWRRRQELKSSSSAPA